MTKVMPSIDISGGKAVKRIKGVRGSDVILGDPLEIANEIRNEGYNAIHVVDLDGAEGVGDNSNIIKSIVNTGFEWVQVGGGVRNPVRASKLIDMGVAAVVVSTVFFIDKDVFKKIVNVVGGDKVLLAIDYRSDGYVYANGWRKKVAKVEVTITEAQKYDIMGVLFTYIDAEGTMSGIDRDVARYAKSVKGLKEYAGGVSSYEDLVFLKNTGFDYAVVGMSFYSGVLRGLRYV